MGNAESVAEQYRRDIEALAYRMLGDWAESQDVAQESLLKWHTLSPAEQNAVNSPRSWLLKVSARDSLDRLKSARRRRESYVGPWLPDPMLVQHDSPADQAEVDESLTMAIMLTLERLTPPERAAFILKDVFDLSFDEIAEAIEKSPTACRKLASRARAAIREGQPQYELTPQKHMDLLQSFFHAIKTGDIDNLKTLLADDAVLYSDSGGLVPSARKVLHGQDVITRLFVGLARKAANQGDDFEARFQTVNGLPALLLYKNNRLESLFSVAIHQHQIQSIYLQRNPQKLQILDR